MLFSTISSLFSLLALEKILQVILAPIPFAYGKTYGVLHPKNSVESAFPCGVRNGSKDGRTSVVTVVQIWTCSLSEVPCSILTQLLLRDQLGINEDGAS